MKHLFKTIACGAILGFTLITNSFGQKGGWDVGGQSLYIKATAPPSLTQVMHPMSSIRKMSFASTVGGVAFNGVAKPEANLKNKVIKLDYISTNNDGNRLRIIVGADTAFSSLPDWQLIPIINFANDSFNACVSLFGPNGDTTGYQIVYHAAFQDKLLGIRILEADMALMNPRTYWQLPKFDGETIIGKGEDTLNPFSLESILKIESYLVADNPDSWIFTDDGIDIKFSLHNKTLTFTGYPYYYFWRRDSVNESAIKKLINKSDSLVKIYNKLVTEDSISVIGYNKVVELYNFCVNNNGNCSDTKLKLDERAKALKILREKIRIDSAQISAINKKIDILDATIPVTVITDSLKDKYALFQSFNLPVYSACLNISHYSALFRYFKRTNPTAWRKLYKGINSIEIGPQVETPNWLPKPRKY